ncbi:MAG: hypothetical protein QOG94_2632 [Solirubrobacteraceae bacterium]|jgi:glutaredoxin|nr:hypothetical protein [Solirubrobacteraceae bacterium]MEA2139237.1 hypothetical protein [Solirubrobacteraceae bacterium]
MILYQREPCPWCKPVRELLTELQVSYLLVNVPKQREARAELIRATGEHFIPALVDGDVVLAGRLEHNQHLLDYLRRRHAAPAEAHAAA